jgi:MFS family permease
MTVASVPIESRDRSRLYDSLVKRQLLRYPKTMPRYGYLGIVVLTTIILYYLYYVEGTITPLMLPYYHMSFLYFLYLLVVSNAIGAFTAFIGGLSDKIGRANLTIYGTLTVGLVQLYVPHIHSRFGFALAYCVIGFVEGVILVSTPALMRDFSPQMGRGAAMGFWALGPTMGSVAASLVATRTLTHLHPWQDQFIISGLVCLVVVAISFVFLRELSPQLRDQLMVSQNERALVEARARGIDVEKATAHPMRSMMKLDLLASSVAIAVFLLFYYASVSVLTIYWVVVFNRSTPDADGINVWYAAFLSGALVFFGVVSDRLRVRKPLMLVGAAGAIVMMIFVILQTSHPHSGYYSNVVLMVLLATAIGCAYCPWMAGYTEQVESHNPALAASGLAIWGWVLRIVVAVSFLLLPRIITTSTTLVDNQGSADDLQTFQAAQAYVPAAGNVKPPPAPASVISALDQMQPYGPGQALGALLENYRTSHDLMTALGAVPTQLKPQAIALLDVAPLAADIQAGKPVSASQIAGIESASPQLASLLRAEEKLVPAQKASPKEWQRWWWACAACMFVFLLLVFAMKGRWSPRAAKRDFDEHERLVTEELAQIRLRMAPAGAGDLWAEEESARTGGSQPRLPDGIPAEPPVLVGAPAQPPVLTGVSAASPAPTGIPANPPALTGVSVEPPVGAGYLATGADFVDFIEWSDEDGKLVGSVQAVVTSGQAPDLSTTSSTFGVTGTLHGSSINLCLDGDPPIFGSLSDGILTLDCPQPDGSLIPVTFDAASASEYNDALTDLHRRVADDNQPAVSSTQRGKEQKADENVGAAAGGDPVFAVAPVVTEDPRAEPLWRGLGNSDPSRLTSSR